MSYRNTAIVLVVLFALAATSCEPSDEKRAGELLADADALYQAGNYDGAIEYLDSLHKTYPRLVKFRREADTLQWTIEIKNISLSLPRLDSMISAKQQELMVAQKDFMYEKDERYEDVGNFVHRKLKTELHTDRCYLKPYCNETGEMAVMSYYVGSPIVGTRLKVTSGDLSVETEPIEAKYIHIYMDGGVNHENLIIPEKELNGLIEFVADHRQEVVKATLMGKGNYTYYLNELERTIFAQTSTLGKVLKETTTLMREQKRLQIKQLKLRERLKLSYSDINAHSGH